MSEKQQISKSVPVISNFNLSIVVMWVNQLQKNGGIYENEKRLFKIIISITNRNIQY